MQCIVDFSDGAGERGGGAPAPTGGGGLLLIKVEMLSALMCRSHIYRLGNMLGSELDIECHTDHFVYIILAFL